MTKSDVKFILSTVEYEPLLKYIKNKEIVREMKKMLQNMMNVDDAVLIQKAELDIMEQIESDEELYEFFKQEGKRQSYPDTFVFLMINSSNKQDIKNCITEGNDILDNANKELLIGATHDIEYIKKCIDDESLGLEKHEKIELIKATKESEYIKNCLENESFKFNMRDKMNLLKSIDDYKYIDKWIKSSQNVGTIDKIELIKSTNNVEYIKNCIIDKTLKLGNEWNETLIEATNDKNYMKQCIENSKIELDNTDKINLLQYINDNEYTKKFAEANKNELKTKEKLKLIRIIQDEKYVLKLLDDKSITINEKMQRVLDFNNQENIKKFIDQYSKKISQKAKIILLMKLENNTELNKILQMNSTPKQIILPENMTIGIEIESNGVLGRDYIKNSVLDNNWTAKKDPSVPEGIEVISPILQKKDNEEIYKICNILKAIGQTISNNCGGHIHIGADYLNEEQDYINLMELWGNTEKLMYIISNQKGEPPRESVNSYARPISPQIEEALENGYIQLDEKNFNDTIKQLQQVQGNRYVSVNLKNVNRTCKNTIEFRIANGTINPDTWIENINLFGSIIAVSHELTALDENSEKTTIFKQIRDGNITDDEKLKDLLNLLFDTEEQKQIYIKRYEENKKLFEKNSTDNSKMFNKKIKFNMNKIIKNVIDENNGITLEDVKEAEKVKKQALIKNETEKIAKNI